MYDIARIVSPFPKDDFLNNFLGIRALFIQGDENKFQDVLDWEDINHISQYTRIDGKWANIVEDKESKQPRNSAEFNQLLRKGATLVLNSLNQKDQVVDEIARVLSADLNMPVNINCYISTPGIQGFDTHYDRHDVFIFHLRGKKAWKVFHPTVLNPTDALNFQMKDPPEDIEPYLEVDMTPGDVLYIPRGHWHYALSDEHCYHLTVGWTSRTPAHFMSWWANKFMQNDPEWRHNLDIVDSADLGGSREEIFNQCAEELREKLQGLIDGDELKDQIKEFVMVSNPIHQGPQTYFPDQQLLEDHIDENTPFALPSGQKIVLKYDEDKSLSQVVARGGAANIADVPEEVIQAIFHSGWPVNGKTVLDKCPDFEWKRLKNIFMTLLDHGVVKLNT